MILLCLLSALSTRALAQDAPVLTRPPELVTFVEAPWPEGATEAGASVVLSLTIGEDGRVEEVAVVESGGPAFDAAALEAARGFVFTPAEVDGEVSRIQILYRYEFVKRVELPTTAIFSGVVVNREGQVPLPGIRITLPDGRWVITDAQGRFEIADLPPGPTALLIEGENLTPITTEETFVAGERLEATYGVFLNDPEEEADDLEILVTAPTLKRQAVSTEVSADEARMVPGTQGDVLKVVENLPGVARASLGTGALVVWGAAPEDTTVLVDGVPVPRLYHDGGLRSVVGSDMVRSVELVPGGYGAAYGRGLGGLVLVDTLSFGEEVHGAFSADLQDASAAVNGPLGQRFNYGFAVRQSYLGPLLSSVAPEVEDTFPIPHYRDGQARLGVELRPNETLDLTVLASSDSTRRTAPSADPAREAAEQEDLSFQRVYLRYAYDLGEGTRVSALAFVGHDAAAQWAAYGPLTTSVSSQSRLAGARAATRMRMGPAFTLEVGVDALVTQTVVGREGSVAMPPREGDLRVFGQPPPDQVAVDSTTVVLVNVAPYVEAELLLLDQRLSLTPGLRTDPQARSVSRAAPQEGASPTHGLFLQDPQLEPRLAARWSFSEEAWATAAVGRYGQQPQAPDLSAAFGNPALVAAQGDHAVLGVGLRPAPPLLMELTAFGTHTEGLARRNTLAQPARAEALLATGKGRSTGVQTMIRLEPNGGWQGWVSYTLSWSQRKDSPELDWRPSDYDQRHAFTAVVGRELPRGFDLSTRLRVATGAPRSEVVGAVYDSRRDLYEPVFGAHNALRLPTFFQLDLRVARSFVVAGTTVDLSLDIQNVTNHKNVEEYIYNADFSERSTITGLPILPVLGARWSF